MDTKKWNWKSVLLALPTIAEQAGVRDYAGDSADEFVAFMKTVGEKGVSLPGLETEAEQRAMYKMVTIEVDGDNVVVNGEPVAATKTEDELDDEDSKAKEAKDEANEELTKAYKVIRKEFGNQVPEHFGKVAEAVHGRSTQGKTKRGLARKRYEGRVKAGESLFVDADIAEVFVAEKRLGSYGAIRDYAQKKADQEIMKKAGATFDNSLGGALIRDGFSDQMIELMPNFGTARKYAGVWSMAELREYIPRFGADVTTYKLAEGLPATESEPTFDGVWLNAEEIGTLSRFPMRLLEHAAVDIADVLLRSVLRSQFKYEDESFWNGANGFEGIAGKIGSNSTYTVAGASSYTDVTVADAQKWMSMLPDLVEDYEDDIAIYCHKSIDDQIFQRFGPAAGGASTIDMVTGRITEFKGVPIRHVNVMNNGRSFTSGNVVAYVGPLSAVTKFGEVSGSHKTLESDQRYMEYRQWASLNSVEIAVNAHNVSDTDESGLWALKVTS